MHKLLYVCLDGLGDDPIPAFDGRTPLEAAETPNLDALARRGRTGRVITVGPGIAPESDIGVFGILGYDPKEEHPGRGVLEAMGIGMDFRDGDLAYRINFATADWPEIVDRRVGRDLTSEESKALADEVNETLQLPGATFDLRATIEHRGALVIRTDDGQALVCRGHQHRPRVPATGPPGRRPGDVRTRRRHGDGARGLRRGPARRRPHQRVRRRVGAHPERLRGERATSRRRPAPRQPDPHEGRRRSSPCAPADRGSLRHAVGVLRRDAGRARHRPGARDGPRRRAPPRRRRIRQPGRGALRRVGGAGGLGPRCVSGAVHPHQGARRPRARRSRRGQARRHHRDRPGVLRCGAALAWAPTRWWPSPPTTPPRACGRRTRPIPSRSWSAAPPSRRTAPSPTANEPANTVPSARGWDPRSCPNSPPRSAAERPGSAEVSVSCLGIRESLRSGRPRGPNMRCGLRRTRLISSAGERQARSRRIDGAREHPPRSRRGPHQLRRRGRRRRARRRRRSVQTAARSSEARHRAFAVADLLAAVPSGPVGDRRPRHDLPHRDAGGLGPGVRELERSRRQRREPRCPRRLRAPRRPGVVAVPRERRRQCHHRDG